MPFTLFLALKYLRAPDQNYLARLTAAAAMVSLVCGVAATIVAQALANGFQSELQTKILANTAHISIFRTDNSEIGDWRELKARLQRTNGVTNASAISYTSILLVGSKDSSYAVLRAVRSEFQIPNFKFQNAESKVQSPHSQTKDKGQRTKDKGQIEISLGAELAEKTGLKAGDAAQVLSAAGDLTAGNFAPTATVGVVADIFRTGLYEYDSTWAQTSLEDAARLTGQTQVAVTAINLETNDIYQSGIIARGIQAALGTEYRVLDWQEANRPLFAALTLERRIAGLIIGLIILVAALNITTTLALTVSERRFDIAVLKTCGATKRSIVNLFLLQGVFIGLIGTLAGVCIGLLVCVLLNSFELITLPADVYSISRVVLVPTAVDVILAAVVALALSTLATILPARLAAAIKPIAGLKSF